MLQNHFVKVIVVLVAAVLFLWLSGVLWPPANDANDDDQSMLLAPARTQVVTVKAPARVLKDANAYIEGMGPSDPETVAQQILDFSESVKKGVDTLVGERKVDPDMIEFATGVRYNQPCEASESCVFSDEGGGVDWQLPPEGSQMMQAIWWYYQPMDDVHVTDLGTEKPEIVMVLVNVMPNVCRALNSKLGIEGDPVPTKTVFNMFKGVKNQFLDAYPGKPAGCWNLGGFGVHYFYYTLLEG